MPSSMITNHQLLSRYQELHTSFLSVTPGLKGEVVQLKELKLIKLFPKRKSYSLSPLPMILTNDPKSQTLEASKMIKQGVKTYWELKRYKKAHVVVEKEVCIQATFTGTQT